MTDPVDVTKGNGTGESAKPLLEVRGLVQEFAVRGPGGVKGAVVHAVSDVSFDVAVGETLGIVGETGSGKSTLARSIVQLPRAKAGEVRLLGTDLMRLRPRALIRARRNVQMVYQDPFGSLNPRWKVAELVAEPLLGYGVKPAEKRRERVRELLDLVGLDPSVYAGRRPHELSGGQCQRVAIARAIALNPALVICDEPVASLDVLIQAQVLNLFERLRAELGLSYLFISHDMALVKQVSDRVAVMHLGQIAEIGPSEELYRRPLHPYTSALLDSIPGLDPVTGKVRRPAPPPGEPPSPIDPPSGCRFRTRCPLARERCATETPPLRHAGPGRQVACHFPLRTGPAGADAPPARTAPVP
jgi:oligopeptide/dipeptide ABC transporter ATP-binding protein